MAVAIAASVATPNRLTLVVSAAGAETGNFTVANLRALITAGTPLDLALAASLGTTDTAAKAQSALITGGAYTNSLVNPNVTVQTFINTTAHSGLAAGAGFGPITVGCCAIATANSPTLQISSGAATVAAQEHIVTVEQIHSVIR